MKQLIRYFTPKKKQNLFEKQKTKAFILIGIIGFVLVNFIIIQNIVTPTDDFWAVIISGSSIAIFILLGLFILK